MYWLIGAFFFIFGAVVGSFLNVVILRYHTGRGVTGRSRCHSCGRTLRAHELVPIVSFLAQRGRCSTCGTRISWQYPVVEFLTGLLFFAVHLKFFPLFPSPVYILHTSYFLVVVSLLVVIAVYDLRHKIVPDPFVFAFIALSFLWGAGMFFSGSLAAPLSWLLAGPVCAAPFALLWAASRGRWMGFGDAKLAWGVGWFLGLFEGASVLLLAFWIGAVVSVATLVVQNVYRKRFAPGRKALTMKSEIPFAPFIILGALIVLFFGFDVRVLIGL